MRKKLWITFVVVIVGALLGFSHSYYEARNIKLVKYTFTHPDIPKEFDSTKIVFIADIHCNQYFSPTDVRSLVDRVNALNPDIIVLGGDNTNKDTIYSNPFFEEIEKLKVTHGIFSVLGNHDYWEDAVLIQNGLRNAGFNICDNQSFWIHRNNDSIKIGGVGDVWEDEQILKNTISDVSENNFCLLISHNPNFVEDLDTQKVDLMLSGHTHGGQVTVFGLYAPIMPANWRKDLYDTGQKYRYGWIETAHTSLYITTGIGMGNFPFRFFAPPEIIEIILRKE